MLLLSIAAAMILQAPEPPGAGRIAAPPLQPGEVEFFRPDRSNPFTRATYQAGSIIRDGTRLRVRIHFVIPRSGLMDIPVDSLVELDCGRRLHRTLERAHWDSYDPGPPRRRTPRARFQPIADGDGRYGR